MYKTYAYICNIYNVCAYVSICFGGMFMVYVWAERERDIKDKRN